MGLWDDITDTNKKEHWFPTPVTGDTITFPEYSTIEDVLATALREVLKCKRCKGKGTIWRRNKRDELCECRRQARQALREYDDGYRPSQREDQDPVD